MIGIAGDWHGNTGWAGIALDAFAELDIKHILQLGDFGIWPNTNDDKYLFRVNQNLVKNGQTLWVTLGNHEDYNRIDKMADHPQHEGWIWDPKFPSIIIAKRGTRWEWEGVSFVSLGGGNSIDVAGRTLDYTWWKQEQITLEDVFNTISGGYADVMLTHDSPTGVKMFGSHRETSWLWPPTAYAYANAGRDMMKQAVDGVKPGLLLHGHYHIFADNNTVLHDGVSTYELHSIGMGSDGDATNLGVLTLSTKQFDLLPFTWKSEMAHHER